MRGFCCSISHDCWVSFQCSSSFLHRVKKLGQLCFHFHFVGGVTGIHFFCGGFADVFHKALCITTASIDTDKCFVDVTSLKLFPPELYLQSKHASFILMTSKYTLSSKPLGDVIIQFKDMST